MKSQTINNKFFLPLICLFFIFLTQNIRSQFSQIKETDLEKISIKNKNKGLPERHNIYHKYTFEVENFENFKSNYKNFILSLKKDILLNDIYIQNEKIIAICDDEKAKKFIQILKKNIHLYNDRLYKINEELLEKNESTR